MSIIKVWKYYDDNRWLNLKSSYSIKFTKSCNDLQNNSEIWDLGKNGKFKHKQQIKERQQQKQK